MTSDVSAISRMRRVSYATYANLPTTGLKTGDLGFATDRLVFYRWSGAAWQTLTIYSGSGVAANIPAAADLPGGSLYYETDTGRTKQVQAGAWVQISERYHQGARAYDASDQTIPNATVTVVALDSERHDTDTIHHLTVNNSRLTFNTAGKYLIVASVRWKASAGGARRDLYIRYNGADYLASVIIDNVANVPIDQSVSTIYDVPAGGYVEMLVFQDTGGNLDLEALAKSASEFMCHRQG